MNTRAFSAVYASRQLSGLLLAVQLNSAHVTLTPNRLSVLGPVVPKTPLMPRAKLAESTTRVLPRAAPLPQRFAAGEAVAQAKITIDEAALATLR